MKNGYKLSLAAIAASISLVGCGSDSDSTATAETVTGQFVDTYVAGLNYTCSSGTTGTTNNMGEYTCNVGDTVEFSLGGYSLGTATASSGIVTPETLYPDNPEAALNVAQVIQSLDTDPTDDIITIPENYTDLDDVTVTVEDENFDTLIEDALDVPLVTEEEAQNHLDETKLMLLLAGKTLYNVGSDNTGDDWIDRVVFNADATSLTWTSLTDSSESGTHSVVIEGDKLILDGDEGPFELTFVEETTDKLVFQGLDENGTVVEEDFMFFDQATAEAYFEGYILITEEKLSGKTFYEREVEYDDWNNPTTPTGYLYASMTFANGTLTRTEVWESNPAGETDSMEFTLPYVLIDGKIRVDASTVPDQDPNDLEGYMWFSLLEESEMAWMMRGQKDDDKNGILDGSAVEFTWALSKPEGYPASL